MSSNAYTLTQEGSQGRTRLGGKGASLAQLGLAGLPVPPWFAISPDAFTASLSADQLAALTDATSAEAIRTVLSDLQPSEDVVAAITAEIDALGESGMRYAVRSSAVEEDGLVSSFAGQLDSFLEVCACDVPARVADVWRSGFGERVLAYRSERGLSGSPSAPAVIVQRMVDAQAAGVAFGTDPVSGRADLAVVAAVTGLGDSLVSGDADADTWRVDRAHRIVEHTAVGASPPINNTQVAQVAQLVRAAGVHFGTPQDIEWAIDGNRLYIVQSRPITTLSGAEQGGDLNIWDNSNIAESYAGVTTPLTFSFARSAYEEVYREFSRLMGVPEEIVAANDLVYARMLGLVRGRIYYNLLSWYRVLALLPGFRANRHFMEQMMGVAEGLPDEIARELAGASSGDRIKDRIRLVRAALRLISTYRSLPTSISRFDTRLRTALAPVDLAELSPSGLAGYYRQLEGRLLRRWDAPIVNDFYTMVFFGLLRSLSTKWCEDKEGTLPNDLLAGEGGMLSAEPARRIQAMAEIAATQPGLAETFVSDTSARIEAAISEVPALRRHYDDYLAEFGDRCIEELKLESPTLSDDPLPLMRSIGHVAQRIAAGQRVSRGADPSIRSNAEARAAEALRGHALRGDIYRWVLRNARQRVLDRENLRLERTRVFGRARRIFLEIGERLQAAGVLTSARDVFYLEIDEILGFIDGTAASSALDALARARVVEFDAYRAEPAPPDRFETRGPVGLFRPSASTGRVGIDGETASGLGCCPGVVRGPVRVITDPAGAVLLPGEILVAERTDPGWVMLFPVAEGLLVERGSLLSHSAIVAREMGIPAVVSISGLTSWLRTGDVVELDGRTGRVVRLSRMDSPLSGRTDE